MIFASYRLCIINVLTGERVKTTQTPFKIGSGFDSDLRLDDLVPEEYCIFRIKRNKTYLFPAENGGGLLLDGGQFAGGEIEPKTDHTLCVGKHCLVFCSTPHPEKWLEEVDPSQWFIAERGKGEVARGPYNLRDLYEILKNIPDPSQMIVACRGLSIGFHGSELLNAMNAQPRQDEVSPSSGETLSEESEVSKVNLEYGEFTCPVCWLKFDRGDIMHIAVHGSLRGDPVLGEDQMQRFYATRFNDRGQALDAMAIPTNDIACPHCRRKLPPNFLDTPHYIFSIVGAPSSGKSYYLSVLIKTLQTTLFRNFGISFRDADPTENVLLNQMKTQLFSAASPAEALLAKTELEGAMYETLPRLGRKVRLPKPFIFQVSDAKRSDQDFSVVFYDNAGEHFEPGRNSADSPGAQHIATASAIFFLFDPLHNSDFRARLLSKSDPQLEIRRAGLDQQDVILAETEVRIKTLLGMDSRQRVSTPLAVIVGKCDTWLDLLDARLENPVRGGVLDQCIVDQNSAIVRQLMVEICPSIVGNAESISNNVKYFAVSAFGSSPMRFRDLSGREMIGPDPGKLNPIFVEIPTLWALSQVVPELVPGGSNLN